MLSLLNMHVQSFQMIFNIFSILRERYQIKFDFDDVFLFSNGKGCKMIVSMLTNYSCHFQGPRLLRVFQWCDIC